MKAFLRPQKYLKTVPLSQHIRNAPVEIHQDFVMNQILVVAPGLYILGISRYIREKNTSPIG